MQQNNQYLGLKERDYKALLARPGTVTAAKLNKLIPKYSHVPVELLVQAVQVMGSPYADTFTTYDVLTFLKNYK